MAKRRAEPTARDATVADPPAPTTQQSTNRKRQFQRQRTSQAAPVVTIDSGSSSSDDNRAQPTRQRKRPRRARASGASAPRPEQVIVIDDDAEPVSEPTRGSRESTTQSRDRSEATQAEMVQFESDDYFEVLGLARDASDSDVKKAYRKLAVQWHPDKNRANPKAEEYFKRIGEAYAVLSDPEKRREYERYGKAGAGGGDAPQGFHGHHGAGFSARSARDIFEAFFGGEDPFAAFFGGAQFSGRGANGRPGGQRHARARRATDPFFDDDGDDGFDFGFGGMSSMMSMMGGFGGGFGGGGGRRGTFGSMGFSDPFFGESRMGFGGAGFSSQSVSSSSYTDRNGHVVTTKTTTTTTPDGRTETVTEEFRNGKLLSSTAGGATSSSTSRLAGAGRLQLDSSGVGPANGSRASSSRGGSAARRDRRQ